MARMLSGPPVLLRDGRDPAQHPQVGMRHREPGLSSESWRPPQTRLQIAPGPCDFQSAEEGCLLLFLLSLFFFKGSKIWNKSWQLGENFFWIFREL
jgi:hypothetical protein